MQNTDPDTETIQTICESLIGSKININYIISLENGENKAGELSNCNIIGDCFENVLFSFIAPNIPTFVEGPKQAPPDFYNRDKEWEWELKVFNGSPKFDVSNFDSFVMQLNENLDRKLNKTKYLIFKYAIAASTITVMDFKLCNIWEIISYTGRYPVSLQKKRGVWYNIRPCSFQ